MGLARRNDIFINGARVTVDWRSLRVGGSFFLPCVDAAAAIRCIEKIFKRKKWQARYASRIENHILGLRVWRIA
jgi:hypothetical protein